MESTAEVSGGNKWLSSAVVTRIGTIEAVRQCMSTFERRTFGPALLSMDEAARIFAEAPPFSFIADVLRDGIAATTREQVIYKAWRSKKFSPAFPVDTSREKV
jgi:hypothetical protein